jgi:hypothetical protein
LIEVGPVWRLIEVPVAAILSLTPLRHARIRPLQHLIVAPGTVDALRLGLLRGKISLRARMPITDHSPILDVRVERMLRFSVALQRVVIGLRSQLHGLEFGRLRRRSVDLLLSLNLQPISLIILVFLSLFSDLLRLLALLDQFSLRLVDVVLPELGSRQHTFIAAL